MTRPRPARSVLVTGASGLIGRQVVRRLAAETDGPDKIVAMDLHPPSDAERTGGVDYRTGDGRMLLIFPKDSLLPIEIQGGAPTPVHADLIRVQLPPYSSTTNPDKN